MRLELTGRHVDVTPALRRLVEARLARLERLLNNRAVSAQAMLSRERNDCRTDITLHARGEKFLHGQGVAVAWSASVGHAIDKIASQAQKVKGKWQERKRRPILKEALKDGVPPAARSRPRTPKIVKVKRKA